MKKTILHITDQLVVGGTEMLLKNTLPLMPQYDYVICYLGGEGYLRSAFAQYPVYCIDHKNKSQVFRSVRRLRKIIRDHKIDIIHAHLFWSSLIARLAKPRHVRLLTTIHSVLSKDAFAHNRLSLLAEQAIAFRQDAVVAVSDYVLKDYLQYVPYRGNTHVLYNFIPDSFFKTRPLLPFPISPGTLRCIAVGNLKPLKNYRYILDAFSQLQGLPITLDIYGEGTEQPHLQEIIDKEGLPVRLSGVNNNMQEVLPMYDVFIQASLYEGYGIALLEAMTVGVIPLLSDIPVHREVTDDKVLYFNLNDTRTLAQLLFHIHAGAYPMEEVRATMMQRAKRIGTADSYKHKLENIYDSLTAEQ